VSDEIGILGSVAQPFPGKKEFGKTIQPLRKFFHYLNENGAVRFNMVMHKVSRDSALNDPKYDIKPSGDLIYVPKNAEGEFEKAGGWEHGSCGALLNFKHITGSSLLEIVHRVQHSCMFINRL
jgi:hypothetical protein